MYIPIIIHSKKLLFWLSIFSNSFLVGALVLFVDSLLDSKINFRLSVQFLEPAPKDRPFFLQYVFQLYHINLVNHPPIGKLKIERRNYTTMISNISFVYFGAKPKPRLTLYEILRFISFHFYFSPVFIAFVISAAPGNRLAQVLWR